MQNGRLNLLHDFSQAFNADLSIDGGLSKSDGARRIMELYDKHIGSLKPRLRKRVDELSKQIPCEEWPHIYDLCESIRQASAQLAGKWAEEIIITHYKAILGSYIDVQVQQEPKPHKKTRSLDLVFPMMGGTLVASVTTKPQERKNDVFPAEAKKAHEHYKNVKIVDRRGKAKWEKRNVIFFGIFFDGAAKEKEKQQDNIGPLGRAIDCRDVKSHAEELGRALHDLT